jgi:hypothetical protein
MRPQRALLVALLAAGVLVGACSSGSKKVATKTSHESPTSSIPAAAQPASGGVPWPAPANAMEFAGQAGLTPETAESLTYHVHAHLDVFVNGSPVLVPGGIGIDITNPGVHTYGSGDQAQYGGIVKACDKPCISPLHTHGPDGVLHTESKTPTPNKLGQFFTEWGVKLDANCVGGYCAPTTSVLVYVNGKKFTDDPTAIELSDRKEIAIVIGTPPARIPKTVPY